MSDVSQVQDHEETNDETPPEQAKAREMGWRPEEEWSGDKDRWMPADEFLDRNERLAARGDKIQKAENAKLTAKVTELTQAMDDLKGHMSRAEQGAYKRALADIQAEQRQAVADSDTEAFDAAAKKAEALQTEAEKVTEKPKNADQDPAFTEWLPDNSWYDPNDDDFDIELSAWADTHAPQLAKKGLEGAALYQAVGKAVKKKFPDKFGNPKRRNAAAVEGAGSGGGQRAAKKGYSDLPADAKSACDRLVKQKVWDRPSQKKTLTDKEARERYANDYFQEED